MAAVAQGSWPGIPGGRDGSRHRARPAARAAPVQSVQEAAARAVGSILSGLLSLYPTNQHAPCTDVYSLGALRTLCCARCAAPHAPLLRVPIVACHAGHAFWPLCRRRPCAPWPAPSIYTPSPICVQARAWPWSAASTSWGWGATSR